MTKHVTEVCDILHKPTPYAHPWQTCVLKYHAQFLEFDALESLQVRQSAEIKTRIWVNKACNEAFHNGGCRNSLLCVSMILLTQQEQLHRTCTNKS